MTNGLSKDRRGHVPRSACATARLLRRACCACMHAGHAFPMLLPHASFLEVPCVRSKHFVVYTYVAAKVICALTNLH